MTFEFKIERSSKMNRTLFWKVYRKSSGGKSPKEFAKSIRYPFLISETEEQSRRPDKLKTVLTEHDKRLLNTVIYSAWCQIAPDMENNSKVGMFALTNLVAVETCLDQGLNMGWQSLGCRKEEVDAATEIVNRLYAQFEPDAVLLYICSLVHLR
jgi:hypothetical protein